MNAPKLNNQSESDFLFECNLPEIANARKVAIAVRLTIAELGGVMPNTISASSKFEDLDGLPFWGPCGDVGFETDTLVRELQQNLGMKLTNAELTQIRDPDLNVRMTIAEFIRDVWEVVKNN